MHNEQEAFTDTYPGCRIHLYLFPGTYHFTADVDLTQVWSGGKVKASNFSISPPITRNTSTTTQGWDRDGCDGVLYKVVVVGFAPIIGSAVAGPVGGISLAVRVLNSSTSQKIDSTIGSTLG